MSVMADRMKLSVSGVCAAILLVSSAVLLFARLGHYALWNDEAFTALGGWGVRQTGDTTALVGHNLVAYGGGFCLRGLHDRYIPPLPAYLTAPFLAWLGNNALAARLPFALCGFGCVCLLVWWLWREGASPLTWVLMGMGLLGNVSFFLFCRQCRYYGLAMLLSVALAYLYQHLDSRRKKVAFAVLSVCLLASNYMTYAAVYGCLAVDYLIWGRRQKPLRLADWLLMLVPQVIPGLILVSIWNPFSTTLGESFVTLSAGSKLRDIWWNFRDLCFSEFGVGILLVVAPGLFIFRRSQWLIRAPVLLLVFMVVMSIVSPVPNMDVAQVRYLAPTIPLWVALAVWSIEAITAKASWLAIPLGILAFGTNVLTGSWLCRHAFPIPVRATCVLFARELLSPPSDPYTVAATWINEHVQFEQSLAVAPDYMMYPLMFHAPKPIYAWQLKYPPEPQFKQLNPIHFEGQVPPDFFVIFGPYVEQYREAFRDWEAQGVHYEAIQTLNFYARDLYRPELMWHVFQPVTSFDPQREAIYIYKRVPKPGTGNKESSLTLPQSRLGRAAHARALWRDGIGTVTFAGISSLSESCQNLLYDNFPPLGILVLRASTRAG
jgi:hypothetical protein